MARGYAELGDYYAAIKYLQVEASDGQAYWYIDFELRNVPGSKQDRGGGGGGPMKLETMWVP